MFTNRIIQYKDYTKGRYYYSDPYRVFYKSDRLTSERSNELAQFIFNSGLDTLRGDSSIKSWSHFNHCETVYFTFKKGNTIDTYDYSCPFFQRDSLDHQVRIIMTNYKKLDNELKFDQRNTKFKELVPKGFSYSYNGYRRMYLRTDVEKKRWLEDKPRRDYLKSVNDTINNYLTMTLKNQSVRSENTYHFEDFDVWFGVDGKLFKVKVEHYDKPRIRYGLKEYFRDKRGIKAQKEIIRKALETVDLGFLKSKYFIHRTFSLDHEGKLEFTDNKIY